MRNRIIHKVDQLKHYINSLSGGIYAEYRSAIVMFHHVSNEPMHDVAPSSKCTIDEFEQILDYVKEDVVSIDEMLLMIRQENYRGRNYVLTFDDVAEDFYHNAFPRLQQANIPFVLYITYEYIDKAGYLSRRQLLDIAASPLSTIGAHTMTHPLLRARGVDLNREICVARDKLSELIDQKVVHFAYPYGSSHAIDGRVVGFTARAGFDSAVATLAGYLNPYTVHNVYRLPRVHNRLFMAEYMHS